MSTQLLKAIAAKEEYSVSFQKYLSNTDAGKTASNQAGIYVSKSSVSVFFNKNGSKGSNQDAIVNIKWYDGKGSPKCRFVYYGQATRNEYRITQLSRSFLPGTYVVIVKVGTDEYNGFILSESSDIFTFRTTFGV